MCPSRSAARASCTWSFAARSLASASRLASSLIRSGSSSPGGMLRAVHSLLVWSESGVGREWNPKISRSTIAAEPAMTRGISLLRSGFSLRTTQREFMN